MFAHNVKDVNQQLPGRNRCYSAGIYAEYSVLEKTIEECLREL